MPFSRACQILVLSEDVMTYGRAMYVCQRILAQFAFEVNFNFRCWDFQHQNDAQSIESTVEIASNADIILLSLGGVELNHSLNQWLQAFSETRSKTEGAFVLILGMEAGPAWAIQKIANQIQAVSGLVGMDFVPLIPTVKAEVTLPPQRETWPRGTGVRLNNERPNYDHWGLNE
jgi:hypothetical protein